MEAVGEDPEASPRRRAKGEGGMDTLTILKLTPSLVRFAGDAMLYFGSRYGAWCEADDFRDDTSSAATLALESDDETLASCALLADPQRRGVRRGTLSLAGVSPQEGRYWLCARLGGNVVFREEVSVFSTALSGPPAGTEAQE